MDSRDEGELSPHRRLCRAILAGCAVLLGGGCTGVTSRQAASGARPRLVLLITLDTTRADRLTCYGYGRDTTPRLGRFAADALVFEGALATSSWTLPSHATLFTGKLGAVHGA